MHYDFSAIHRAFDHESESDLRYACLQTAAGVHSQYGPHNADAILQTAQKFFDFVNGDKGAGDH